MRLIAAYIAGFGRLTDFCIDYEKGLTALCMENGWGKTTLAYFHKAMFYGLDSTGKQIKGDIRERERYKPWSGSPFGGWLEFAVDSPDGEKSYRIERSFGEKPAKDQLRLLSLPDLRPCTDFADPIGMALFGLNAASFIRTVFCTGTLHTPPQTPDSGLLSERFGENPADGKTLDRAIDRLEERRAELQKRGDKGQIPDLRREIYGLDQQIRDCRLAADEADRHRKRLEEIDGELADYRAKSAEIRAQIDLVAKKQALSALSEQYRSMLARVEALEREKSEAEEFFRSGGSTEADLTLLQGLSDQSRLAAGYAGQTAIPFGGEQEYAALANRFRSGLPDEEALSYHREIENRLALGRRQEGEIRESADFARLSARFSGGIPEEATVERMLGLAHTAPTGRSPKIGLLAAGGAMLVAGIVCLICLSGILRFAAAGLLCTAAPVLTVLAFAGKIPAKKDPALTEFLAAYGIPSEDPLSGLHKLRLDASLYRSRIQKLEALSRENRALSDELAEFIDYYRAPDRRTLEAWVNRYVELSRARKSHREAAETARKRAAMASGELAKLLARYPVDPTDPEEAIAAIRSRSAALAAISRTLSDAKREADDFALQHPAAVQTMVCADPEDLSTEALPVREAELSEKQEAAMRARLAEEGALRRCAETADRLLLLREELAEKTEKFEQATAALAAIERAETLLKQASRNLSDRYLSGIRESFARYLAKLMPADGEDCRYRVDGSLEVLSEEAGMQRPSMLLSAGRRDLTALCARLALTDALLDGKGGFLILDDPFTNLDDGRILSALTLLGELAENRQILYLTCSRSRMPKESDA